MKKFLSVILFSAAIQFSNAQTFISKNDAHQLYEPQTIIFKVLPQYRSACDINSIANQQLNDVLQQLGATSFGKIFPKQQPPSAEKNSSGQRLTDLSLIYKLRYSSTISVDLAISMIRKTNLCQYVEPSYIYEVNYTPNDPQTGLQYYLTNINAYQAWDIEKGDTNVVIGIVDSGTDWDHPDLQSNIKYNYADPINSTDDDNDGYIDNYRGWDISENDNNPMCDLLNHGSHVSGCADAVTDNNTGVASPGFHCKFLPVKVAKATSTGTIDNGYEGIVYAADHGCSVINCSWGGPGGGSYGQDAISYATNNHNCLVVASAGNGGNSVVQYPAAYDYVLAVASTTSTDVKSSFSTFGFFVDVSAPGSGIYSTVMDNTYTFMSGTSMASPITCGAAAIVKSHFPGYTGLQVGEQLRVTCDNIYTIPANANYANKLGKGRINMYNALTMSSPSVRYTDMVYNDFNDNSFVIGDTVRIGGKIRNFLAPTSNLILTITTTSGYATILNNTSTIGVLNTMDSTDNYNSPFSFKINPGTPQNAVISFKLTITDGSYNDFQLFDVTVNVDYINITINKIFTTICSKPRIGYNADGQLQGLGFDYNNNGTMMYDGGLMIGKDFSTVSDVIRGTNGNVNDADFQSAVNVSQIIPAVKSDFDVAGKFNDNAALAPMSLLVTHHAYAWDNIGDDKYVIVEYVIKNNGSSPLANLFAGTCFDWDIQAYAHNKAAEDATIKMGYAWNTDPGGLWAGVKVLTATPFNHYAIDNIQGGSGGVDTYGDFTSAEKYTSLSTSRPAAGGTGVGNDVIDVVSTGPFTINAGDSLKVAFALIAGDDLSDLTLSANNAQIKYDNVLGMNEQNNNTQISLYPNPSSDESSLQLNLKHNSSVTIKVLDLQGKIVSELTTQKYINEGMHIISLPLSNLVNGVYLLQVSIDNEAQNLKLIKM